VRHRDYCKTKKENVLNFRNIFRIILRDYLTLVTNMTGLSFGLAASILLAVFIQFELSFDRYFTNADRIFRMNSTWIDNGEVSEMPINLRQAYLEIPGRVPGIEQALQIYRGGYREVIYNNNRYKELNLLFADPCFFQLFDLHMISGDPEEALSEPNTVVLTKKIALRIFGTADVIGESYAMEGSVYTVSAVVEDLPPNTHFQFDMLMPMESEPDLDGLQGLEFFTYFLIKEGIDPGPVCKTIASENTRMLSERFSSYEGSTFDSRLEPLKRIHLHTAVSWDLTPPGNIKTIYIMLMITIAVMGLALSNFINLYILNGARRSREIGIRKVNGASRKSMIRQFYMETTAVVSIAFLAAAILAELLIPPFSRIMQRDSFTGVTSTPALYLVLAAIYLVTIFLSGLYPALLLSRAAPVPLIRGNVNPAGDKKRVLQLVSVVQISIAVTLLTILLGINTQIRYLKHYSMGYNPENIVLVYNLNQGLTENYQAIHDNLLNINGIEEVAASDHSIGAGTSGQGIRMYGEGPDQVRGIAEYRVLPGLCHLYQFNLVAGRFLDPERKPDRSGVILNEAAVSMLGSTPRDIIGESVVMFEDPMEVIGVVKDFHYQTAARKIEPLVINAYSDRIRNIVVRYAPWANPQEILKSVEETITSFDPAYVMMHQFATDVIERYYRAEERLQKILMAGSILSVLIVLLGIYALISHNMVRRTKEIGIRKVLGGTIREMMILIYFSTLKWTLFGSLLAVPLAIIYLNQWLSNYMVRIPLYWWIFASSVALVVLFQSLITLGKTRRTARRNPVEALRYE
jgi:putative ABC transport system permease protein